MEENQVINQAKQLENYMKYKFKQEMFITEVDIETLHNLISLCENLINTYEKEVKNK